MKSLEQLYALGALTDEGKLSAAGHHMARLPLDPMYAKALIQASTFNCLEEMLIAVAMLSVESIFYFPREKIDEVRLNKTELVVLGLLVVFYAGDDLIHCAVNNIL